MLIKSPSCIDATALNDVLWLLYSIQTIADNLYEMIISGEIPDTSGAYEIIKHQLRRFTYMS
jgi:hypothetical protein